MDRDSTLRMIRERLAPLDPLSLEIIDESDLHAGHAGAKQGGHFRLDIVAECFSGLSRLQCQRLVLDKLGELHGMGIHAISVTARSPGSV